MTPAEYDEWIEAARQHTQVRMRTAQEQFGLGQHARYQIDLPTATIRFFSAGDVEEVRADIQVAGSWSPTAGSWLWGWDNQSVPAAASSRVLTLRELGNKENLERLSASFADCDEGEAWSMASAAAQALDAQCVYRAAGPKSHLFLLLFALRRMDRTPG